MTSFSGRRRFGQIVVVLLLIGLLAGVRLTLLPNETTTAVLSSSERIWLDQHPEIVLAPQAWFYPFEFFDDSGIYRGVAADYIALLEQRLGFKFKILKTQNLAEWQAAAKDGKVDVLAAARPVTAPAAWMQVMRPHIVFPGVIVANEGYQDLSTLADQKVAVIAGQQWGTFLAANASRIQVVSVPDPATALEEIAGGRVRAMVSDIATVSYYIHREGMTEIRVVGQLDQDLKLGIATRRDWPELTSIMTKALAGISDEERAAISRQWIHLKAPALILGRNFWTIVTATLATVLLVFLGFLFWNRSLRRQVATRTRNLKQELEWRTAAEMEIQEAYEQLSLSHDELKETQLQLIRAAKMESVGSLAAGVAHEVKNPLMQMRLGLDYLKVELQGDATCQEVVRDMENAVRRADSVVNSLLDFSRENELSRDFHSLNSLIEESLQLVRHVITQKAVQVELRLQDHLPKIFLDENKIHQVFINLIHNAVQAVPRNGRLQIATSLAGWPGEKTVIAEVNDSGPGISAQNMNKVFDPFYTTKPVGEGTGLGLYVVRNILELHEAQIELSNSVEGGLSVRVCFNID